MFHNFLISSESAMLALGKRIQQSAQKAGYPGSIIYLIGDLGAGKTTLVRGFVQAMGHHGSVKSPTYTLVEPYEFESAIVNHFDFYRIDSPDECEQMGIRDYFGPSKYCFLEWPQKGEGVLPTPSLKITIAPKGQTKREVMIEACDTQGELLLQHIIDTDE